MVYAAAPDVVAADLPSAPGAGTVRVKYPPRRVFDVTYEKTEDVVLTPQA